MPRKQKKYHFIYKTTNLLNNKFYVGMHSTDDLGDGYVGSGKRLWYSINKYGLENHKCEILEFLDSRETLKKREAEVINEELLSDPLCMNLKFGGEGGWDHQNSNSDVQRSKGLSGNEAMTNRHKANDEWSKEFRDKISAANKEQWASGIRVPSSTDHLAKMTTLAQSDSAKAKRKETFKNNGQMLGEKNPMFGKCWVFKREIKENRVINERELATYIDDGWERGKVFTKWEIDTPKEKVDKKEVLKSKILSSDIDVTKKGWPIKMANDLGISRQYVKRFIKVHIPELWDKCFIEVNKIR